MLRIYQVNTCRMIRFFMYSPVFLHDSPTIFQYHFNFSDFIDHVY
ncbi:Uncharacterized protein dnl_41610 [Desulfonema limicola]|uniref:Uncharacterized protein n=1 Tax=Desulfonema limicola TaxID=45656 RepID=A0A975GHQ9_9BACT|nr:Uncharacterized protein dnl_41610 [Desulfonema limicola]